LKGALQGQRAGWGRLGEPGRAWLALAALLAAGSVGAWWLPAAWLDWQPARALQQPWRAWTAVAVHWSELHLQANLGAALAVAAFGWAARLPPRAALAWVLAWPLTHAALLIQPALAHYGGLSGVLHAGVAVATLWLMVTATGRARLIGAAVFIGMLIKLASEEPWGPPLRVGTGFDIATAPLAHSTGAAAGLLCATVCLAGWPLRGAVPRR
jgi:rhomboid family GlyGly-CTERM serine protease